jgi:hypothetical protein
MDHVKDEDCTVDPETNCCSVCGTAHGGPCYHCRARAFHLPGCVFLLGNKRRQIQPLQRVDRPDLIKFVAVDRSIMRGAEHIATACSNTFARRIARALNEHQPNSRGV